MTKYWSLNHSSTQRIAHINLRMTQKSRSTKLSRNAWFPKFTAAKSWLLTAVERTRNIRFSTRCQTVLFQLTLSPTQSRLLSSFLHIRRSVLNTFSTFRSQGLSTCILPPYLDSVKRWVWQKSRSLTLSRSIAPLTLICSAASWQRVQ